MSNNIRINYIEFPARDFDAVEAFYSAAFGWTFTDYGDAYRAFNDGQLDGGFYKAESESSATKGSALVVLFAEDLERVRDRVVDSGGKIAREIFAFPGGRRFHFTDPNGNELAVWSDKGVS